MKIRQDYVSNQFHQVYFTFSAQEMNQIFADVMETHNISEKEAKKQKKYLQELVMEKIEEEIIDEEISRLDIVPIFGRKFRYLTRITRNNPLLVICQFCILPPDIQLKFPTKIPKEIFKISHTPEVVRGFVRQILLQNGEYEFKLGEVAKKGSVVKYDIAYTREDYVISEIEDQEINLNDIEQPECALFLNAKVGDEIILDEDNSVTVIAKVKEIRNLSIKRLTNKIVEKLNFLNTKTVSEFNQKITDILNFSATIIILLNYLAEFVLQTNNIEFDDYVLNFFLELDDVPKSKKEREKYIEDLKRDLVKEYIIWVINLNHPHIDSTFMHKIVEEYEFDKILFNNPMRIDGYQEFINRHAYEVRVLQYCIDHNIIDYIN